MSNRRNQRRRTRAAKIALQQMTDQQLCEVRRSSNDRYVRMAAKSLLIGRHRPILPFRYVELNQRPAPTSSEEVWEAWRREWDTYRDTEEYHKTVAAIDTADRLVNEMLGEDEKTPQSGNPPTK